MIEVTLPWPPSVNEYWHHTKTGQTYISPKGRAFRDEVIWECKARRVKPEPGRLAVVIRVCPPDRRRRDLDNLGKGVLDSLQHAGAYKDDSLIDDLRIYRGPIVEKGAVHVQIREHWNNPAPSR